MENTQARGAAPSARPQSVDANALAHQARRLARAAEAPWLHAEVAARMAERLEVIKIQPERVLQWAAWFGASTAKLAEVYPRAELVNVEPLPDFAARSAERDWRQRLLLKRAPRVLAPAELAAGQAQLVWANMILHAAPDARELIDQWHAALAVDGFVMFSCLGPDSFIELRRLFDRHRWPRPAPEWWDMHDLGDLLVKAGFADPVMDQERVVLRWGSPEALLRDLRALGGNLAPTRFAGLRGRGWHAQLLAALESLRDDEGRLALTLELVQGHAFKPQPRLAVQERTEISLDRMREMVRSPRKP
ncbi:MAG: methyltransferase domain-containing protein [Pelomonas sp.]|nr:methyltransferase domain-containing protein [Roseateles sp.]